MQLIWRGYRITVSLNYNIKKSWQQSKMTLQQLRQEFTRLNHPENIPDCIEAINLYCEFLIRAAMAQKDEKVTKPSDSEARLLVQMVMTKALHLKNAISGVSYDSKVGLRLNNIVDPTIIASLIRNLYETVGAFNLIYRVNADGDERTIIYNLWVHSGLKYRQRFANVITTDVNRKKLETEQQTIDNYINQIENTNLYKSLSEKDKLKIQNQIKNKEYLIQFHQGKVIVHNWRELYKTMKAKEEYFGNLYTFFSLYTHPSNVAVFQFRDFYKPETNGFIGMTTFNLQYFYLLTSMFIADYINLYPNLNVIFNSLPLMNQLIINFHNNFARGSYDYSINDSWKSLG